MRRAFASLLVAVLGVGIGGEGAAPLELSATMAPQTVHYPATREIVYRLEIATGEDPQRLRVALEAPLYVPGGQPAPRTAAQGVSPVGSPVRLAQRPVLEGPGKITAFEPGLSVSIAGRTPCQRGYAETSAPVASLEVPASSRTTLVVRAETGRAAPWPDTDYRLAFVVTVGEKTVTVRPPAPALTGDQGARIRFHVAPGRRPRRGDAVRVAGSIAPALAGVTLIVRYAAVRQLAPGQLYVEGPDFPRDYERPRVLQALTTDSRGRVESADWRPRRRPGRYGGDYAVWLTYRPSAPHLVAERTCPAFVSVR